MSQVRRQQRADLVKLTIFIVVALSVTVYLSLVIGGIRPGHRNEYHAMFKDVSGLQTGDEVRIAGVNVGKVDKIEVQPDATVAVTFSITPGNDLNTSTTATVQYRNLIGDRIIELNRTDPAAPTVDPGATIPMDHTQAALDLDTLLNGFKPLFAGLNPAQINELSGLLIQVLQGQQSAVATLVSTVGSFTNTIADRETLITQVVHNLNTVLGTVYDRRDTLGTLIDQLDTLMTGLSHQDTQVLDAATKINGFARDAAGLLKQARVNLNPDLVSLALAAKKLNGHADTLQALLTQLPKHYTAIQDTASYGNFFNFFLCGVSVKLTDNNGNPITSPMIKSDAARCQ